MRIAGSGSRAAGQGQTAERPAGVQSPRPTGDVWLASRPTAPAPARLAPPTKSLRPSVFQAFALTNEEMGRKIGQDALGVLENPLGALGSMVKAMTFPFIHPVAAADQMAKNIKADPLDGLCDVVGTLAGSACIVTVAILALAALAAPFTGGASLVIAAGALGGCNILGLVCAGADAAGMLLHEVRGAQAKSDAQAKSEGDQLASYTEDEALTLGTWNAADGFLNLVGEGPVAHLHSNVAGNVVGLVGVYDTPPAAPSDQPYTR